MITPEAQLQAVAIWTAALDTGVDALTAALLACEDRVLVNNPTFQALIAQGAAFLKLAIEDGLPVEELLRRHAAKFA